MEEIQNSLLQYIEEQENNAAYFADFTKLVDKKKKFLKIRMNSDHFFICYPKFQITIIGTSILSKKLKR